MAQTADIGSLLAHADWLRGLARRLVSTGADDAVQETFVAALRSPPAADKPARPWLARVLRNATRMEHRGATRRARREDLVAAEDATQTSASARARPDDAIARVETFRVLVELVLALDEPLRTTVVHHYFEGDSLADIARRDGVPEGTVRWRHKQAIEKLREALDARSGGDRRAWLAALAPLAAPPHAAAAAGGTGALLANKLLVAAALAVAASGVVAWRIVVRAAAPAASAGRAAATQAAASSAPSATGEPAAAGPVRHVRRLSADDRRALAAQIASAHAQRERARDHASTEPPAPATSPGARLPSSPALFGPTLTAAGSADGAALDNDTIRAAMREVIPFVLQCYETAQPTLGADHLAIHAHFTITGDPDVGSLVDAQQLFDDDDHPLPTALDDCVRSTIQTLELPPIGDGETVEVNYPLLFTSRGSGSD